MLDAHEIKRRLARAMQANPGLRRKQIADACDVTPQAVGDWIRTGRIDKRHFETLAALTHTTLALSQALFYCASVADHSYGAHRMADLDHRKSEPENWTEVGAFFAGSIVTLIGVFILLLIFGIHP